MEWAIWVEAEKDGGGSGFLDRILIEMAFLSFIKTVFIKHLGLWGYNGEHDRTFDSVV